MPTFPPPRRPIIAHLVRSVALLCAALALLPLTVLAQQGPGGEGARRPVAGPLIGRKIPLDKLGRLSGKPGADTVSVLVELDDEPTVATYGRARQAGGELQAQGAARRQLARVRLAQSRLASALAPLGARELYRVQRVANGVAVRVPTAQLAAVAALPGVKAIWPLVPKRPNNATSVPLIGAPAVWGGTSKATGAGTTIAVIDTGIDYLHPDFGGSGLKTDYDAIDTTVRGSAFPTAKVAGGYDLVGDNYNASDSTNATPQPDPNPIDCVKVADPGSLGHGSHVAGTAAGLGVLKSGATYTGAYTNALDFGQFRIGPGVAPEAKLYAYRVFGCEGSSEVIAAAIDAAIDPNGDGDPSDHVDVINMSLGIDYGTNIDYPGDPDITATNAAVKAGVIVVASAGNAGDTYYIAGGPSSADGAISVAASDDGGSVADGFRVTAPAAIAGDYAAVNSAQWDWSGKPDAAGTLVYPPTQRDGCAPFSLSNTAIITGHIALLNWAGDTCSSAQRVNNAATAGAIGVIIVYDQPVIDFDPLGSPRIPAVVTLPSVGQTLKDTLVTQPEVNVVLTKDLISSLRFTNPELVDTLASFSSRGPRSLDGVLKPDITAPGETIFSVKIGPGGQGQTLSGTSMAAPHVAGTMALLRELHPSYSVAELKALAMNTATNDVRAGESPDAQIYGPARVGAGRVDVPNAAAGTVVAYNAATPNLVSVSFGNVEVVTTTTVIKQVTVANKGASGATFDVAYNPIATVPGAAYSVSPALVTLAPGASATVNVTLSVDAALTRHTHDPTVSETQVGDGTDWGRQWQSEASGYLTLTPQSATRTFKATIRGYYENPPTKSAVEATGLFTYTEATRGLDYSIRFSQPITLTAGHIHNGKAGQNGPVAQGLTGATGKVSSLSGTLTLTTNEAALLLNGGLYANFHTEANKGGELRGQIVAGEPALRVPVHAAVRAASNTRATAPTFKTSVPLGATGAISITGDDVLNVISTTNPLLNAPSDDVSIVSAFELQAESPQLLGATTITASTDLRYVGVTSDFRRTVTSADPNGVLDQATLYFGIATYGNWTTLGRDNFEVDLDVDGDGVNDYALFNSTPDGSASDIQVAALCPLNARGRCSEAATIVGYVNVLAGNELNTNALDNSVLVLPLPLDEMPELAEGASRISYSVSSFDYYYGLTDTTPTLSYDPAKPGIDLSNADTDLGPAHLDLNGGTIPFTFNIANYGLNGSRGALLLHHHGANVVTRAEVLRAPTRVLLPLVAR